jgi:hypothetical protein
VWVGTTQDRLALNVDLASVMGERRRKTVWMRMRYSERVIAACGGMAVVARPREGIRNERGRRFRMMIPALASRRLNGLPQ